VFAKDNGDKIGSVRQTFEAAVTRAGVVDFHILVVRRGFASWLVMAGVEMIDVRDPMGRSEITTTERYAHLAPRLGQQAVGRLGQFGYRDEGAKGDVTLESR